MISILMLALCLDCFAQVPLGIPRRVAKVSTVNHDLSLILAHAKLSPETITFKIDTDAKSSSGEISCEQDKFIIKVSSPANEWVSTFYEGLQLLGFYFPHPRMQISPTLTDMKEKCGLKYDWEPAFKHRGFHLHTMHPNEWVHGFLMDTPHIADELVRWLARNHQNVFDLNILRDNLDHIAGRLVKPFALARDFGINTGLSIGAALQQQNSFKLIPLFNAITGIRAEKALRKNLRKLMNAVEFDFLTMEAGTSEFTSVNYEQALEWIEAARQTLATDGRKLMIKVHVSTNQSHPDYGNFNFLPQYSHPEVGVLPHTVMFYGLWDEKVPMYGNEDFSEMRNFALEQNLVRPTWYYPETSYWILMDMDVPLYLTDFMLARADDMKRLSENNLEGHFNFTTGHEVGYWLIDWSVALLANKRHNFDPYAAVRLIGEDVGCWKREFDFQNKHFKKNQLISILSFPNVQDEITTSHRIHERNTVKELSKNRELLEDEIRRLDAALAEMPSPACIKSDELRTMVEVTHDRIKHAWLTRLALRYKKKSYGRNQMIMQARNIRLSAQLKMEDFQRKYERYPEAKLFDRNSPNPTSYSFGYVYNSVSLHYWEREEEMIRKNRYSFLMMNIYNIFDIIF